MSNYYDILGVSNTATDDEIKKAYRKLAFKYHPDRNQGNQEAELKMKEINAAYDVIGDPQKRREYDLGYSSQNSWQNQNAYGNNYGSNYGNNYGQYQDTYQQYQQQNSNYDYNTYWENASRNSRNTRRNTYYTWSSGTETISGNLWGILIDLFGIAAGLFCMSSLGFLIIGPFLGIYILIKSIARLVNHIKGLVRAVKKLWSKSK